jgi:hypothetical protein
MVEGGGRWEGGGRYTLFRGQQEDDVFVAGRL